MRASQINIRVSCEEKVMYDKRRTEGSSTEVALMCLLHERVQPIPVFAASGPGVGPADVFPMPRMPAKVTVFEDSPAIEVPARTVKSDFKGKGHK